MELKINNHNSHLNIFSRDRSNSNSRNRKDRSPSTGGSKERGSNRPSPSNKESPTKDRRGSKLAQIYEDDSQQVLSHKN